MSSALDLKLNLPEGYTNYSSLVKLDYEEKFEPVQLLERKIYSRDRDVLLVMVHGFGSHTGRLAIQELVDQGYSVYCFDQRGHGKSQGAPKGFVGMDEFIGDLKHLVTTRAELDTFKNVFVFGHSMGGLVVLSADIEFGLQQTFKNCRGVITTGAALKMAPEMDKPWLRKTVRFIGWLAPTLNVHSVPASYVSRDPKVVKLYESDPLVYPKMAAGCGVNFMDGQLKFDPKKLQCSNLLLMHGGADKVITPEASTWVKEEAKQIKDITCKIYDDFYHEIMKEPNHEPVFKDMFEWIEKRRQ